MRVRETCLEIQFLATGGDYSGDIEPIDEEDWGNL